MNIMYCGDKNIKDGLIISILSLLKNTNEKLNIYILTINFRNDIYNIEAVSDNIINYLDEKVKNKNKDSFVKKIDVTDLFSSDIPEINMNTRFTPCCMLRLFSDEIDTIPDRILYLDADVVVRKNIDEFYNQDLEGYEMAGVLDYYGRWFFRNNIFKMDYLNSGVLLLNMKMIKATGLFKNAREMCKCKKMFMPDQSALNKLCKKNKKILPRKYNEQKKLKADTVIQHFTTTFKFFPWIKTVTIKPWDIDRVHDELKLHEYDDILDEYQKDIKDLGELNI